MCVCLRVYVRGSNYVNTILYCINTCVFFYDMISFKHGYVNISYKHFESHCTLTRYYINTPRVRITIMAHMCAIIMARKHAQSAYYDNGIYMCHDNGTYICTRIYAIIRKSTFCEYVLNNNMCTYIHIYINTYVHIYIKYIHIYTYIQIYV